MISVFLGTVASEVVDINLLLQFGMGLALLFGWLMARLKKYAVHGICQTTVLLLNAAAIAVTMGPSFRHIVLPSVTTHWRDGYYLCAAIHGLLGIGAEAFGIYIILSAGTKLIPERFRIRRLKFWMRIALAYWWIVLLAGAATYVYWYTSVPLP